MADSTSFERVFYEYTVSQPASKFPRCGRAAAADGTGIRLRHQTVAPGKISKSPKHTLTKRSLVINQHFPNKRRATLARRLFVRAKPGSKAHLPEGFQVHTLEELYSLSAEFDA
jgi:hypothetical protein